MGIVRRGHAAVLLLLGVVVDRLGDVQVVPLEEAVAVVMVVVVVDVEAAGVVEEGEEEEEGGDVAVVEGVVELDLMATSFMR